LSPAPAHSAEYSSGIACSSASRPMSCSNPASISDSARLRLACCPSSLDAIAASTLRRQIRSWSSAVPLWPRRPWISENPSARLRVAFRPSIAIACVSVSMRRRVAYSGELATRSSRALRAGSTLMICAAAPRVALGSCASAMICIATLGGDGRLRQCRRVASSSGRIMRGFDSKALVCV